MKILSVIGARPQFIKASVVSEAIEQMKNLNEIIVHTGQHYDKKMSDIFFEDLNLGLPKYNLNIGGGTHGQNTGRMIEAIENLLILERPDIVIVYGDTDSTLAGAIAASKLNIAIAHIEAGLRSFNKKMPEEINRIITDHISTILFVPSINSKEQLIKEGIDNKNIEIVGDVMYDALLNYEKFSRPPDELKEIDKNQEPFILCTVHRAENTDNLNNLQNILYGLFLSKKQIIFPVHPRTKNQLLKLNKKLPDNIKFIDAVGYLEMLWLEKNCTLVVTDSGGIQKEAYFNKKICLTLREETEWKELVENGFNILVGTDPDKISSEICNYINIKFDVNKNFYGDGKSAKKIANYFSNIDNINK